MTVREISFNSEDTGMKAWQVASLAAAINEAIFRGSYDVETYEGALFTLVCLAGELQTEVRALTDNLFEALGNENKSEV